MDNSFHEICDFFPEVGLVPWGSLKQPYASIQKSVQHLEKIVISLSGGVDSMVLSFCLKKLLPETRVIAVHINYNNRDTSIREAEFVRNWCALIGLEFDLTSINDCARTKEKRNEYEQVTKNIRFSAYKKHNCPVYLGHNKDDMIENLITNISSSKQCMNMFGMKEESLLNDVSILRPMLNVSKSLIVQYAHKVNIPYLYDSTPKWSRRGKLRDQFIPIVNQIEPGFLKGLEKYIISNSNNVTSSIK
jgi:tRNA(Ile)-lysidine synthase